MTYDPTRPSFMLPLSEIQLPSAFLPGLKKPGRNFTLIPIFVITMDHAISNTSDVSLVIRRCCSRL